MLQGVTSVLFSEGCFPRKDLASYLYFPRAKVGSIQLVVFAEFGENFRGFGCVSPGIVSFSERWGKVRKGEAGLSWETCLEILWKGPLKFSLSSVFHTFLPLYMLSNGAIISFFLLCPNTFVHMQFACEVGFISSLTHFFFTSKELVFYLFERQRHRERRADWEPHLLLHSPPLPNACNNWDCAQVEAKSQGLSSGFLCGRQVLEPSLGPSKVSASRKLDRKSSWDLNSDTPMWDLGISSSIIAAVPVPVWVF